MSPIEVNGAPDGYAASLRPAGFALVPQSNASKRVPRKILESVVVVAAGVGLMAFGTYGSFTDVHTPFPPVSVSDGR